MVNLYLGPTYGLDAINGTATSYAAVANLLSMRKIVAIYQGRSEAGPRALGNRSILFDPTVKDGQDIVNVVKKREAFRPFAGVVMQEYASQWFDVEESPHMTYAVKVKTDTLPAITHVDGTCRVQTVTKEQNEHLYNLLDAYNRKTGIPILLNTSFNLAGEPLVETPEEAINTHQRSAIDYLYFPEVQRLL